MKKQILIAGSSGFIGSNLAHKLMSEWHYVIGIDIEKPKYFMPTLFYQLDLAQNEPVPITVSDKGIDEVYVLACLMGGMGYIGDEEKHSYEIAVGSTAIIINMINYCRKYCPKAKIFYSSSACVYNQDLQSSTIANAVASLKESDMIPASPDLLYGWQKLYSEKMFQASKLDVRIARFHNVFGRWGSYDNGKEKAPAALCRKVSKAADGDHIRVWGTGEQIRSFLFIDECLEGIEKLMQSDYHSPINIGSDEPITINNLAQMIIDISGKKLKIKNIEGNVGVHSRNSDNTLIKQVLGWSPSQPLKVGIEKLFHWVDNEINKNQK